MTRRAVSEILIAGFCIFHMAAVAVYAAPKAGPLLPVKKFVSPYILLTSQWQGWDLFSPDPLRRVAVYGIERLEGETWRPLAEISPQTLPFWRHSSELKLLGRIESNANTKPLREAYLREFCRSAGLPPDAHVRFVERWYVLPRDAEGLSQASRRLARPPTDEAVTAETDCFPQPR